MCNRNISTLSGLVVAGKAGNSGECTTFHNEVFDEKRRKFLMEDQKKT
jgi:hypothetical protein